MNDVWLAIWLHVTLLHILGVGNLTFHLELKSVFIGIDIPWHQCMSQHVNGELLLCGVKVSKPSGLGSGLPTQTCRWYRCSWQIRYDREVTEGNKCNCPLRDLLSSVSETLLWRRNKWISILVMWLWKFRKLSSYIAWLIWNNFFRFWCIIEKKWVNFR